MNTSAEKSIQGLIDTAAETFQVSAAVLCVAKGGEFWTSTGGAAPLIDEAVLEICRRPLETGQQAIYQIELENTVPFKSLTGTLILSEEGQILGSLSLLDARPRTWTEAEERVLKRHVTLATELLKMRTELTGRTALESALRESKERFQSAFDQSAIGIALVSPSGRWLRVNRALSQFLGYTQQELLTIDFQSVTHPDDLEPDLGLVRKVLKGELETYSIEKRYFHRDGRMVWALLTVSLVRDAKGEPLYFISQVQDISSRKATERSLMEARDEAEWQRQIAEKARTDAEAANRAKSEFLSRLSHELRTPLNAILGFGQLLELSSLSGPDQQSVGHILKGGRHLLNLINEVLDVARIESGALVLSPEPVSVAQVCIEALDLVKPIASQYGMTLQERGVRDLTTHVMADQQKLKQVLLNLLSNGIKYNHPGGVVSLRVESVTGNGGDIDVRILVEDTGMGIPPEKLERLFTPFDRLGAETTEIEGSGIGLAVSQRLATAMRGRLGVDSTLGVGSTFWVQLPYSGPPKETVQQMYQRHNTGEGLAVSTRWVVLCIEDNPANLQVMSQVFAWRPAIRLLSASDASSGLELAQQHNPDLILLGLHVKASEEENVLTSLRKNPKTASMPVVVISDDSTSEQLQKLLEAGATTYVTEPLDVNHLLQTVDNLLAVRATAKQSQNLALAAASSN